MATFDRLKQVICKEFSFPEADLTPHTLLLEIADYDSLDVMALFMVLEEEFGVEVGDEADWMRTVQDAVDFIDGKRVHPRLLRQIGGLDTIQ